MTLLRLPEPYDFELSTGRYRAFGPDRANLWHEGALHRVVAGRDVRIAAAAGGVEVEPLDGEIERVVRTLLGADFDLASFYGFARGDAVLADLVERFPGLRPPLNPDPFETLVTSITAQQVSLHSAFAVSIQKNRPP
jgi:3-methyladenine DNA glycosylase/8-oxoguanine DNA glycosylase